MEKPSSWSLPRTFFLPYKKKSKNKSVLTTQTVNGLHRQFGWPKHSVCVIFIIIVRFSVDKGLFHIQEACGNPSDALHHTPKKLGQTT